MRDFELVLKAAGDPTRARILKLLERGGLCVCQVQAVLGLAFSTVSKHLSILKAAGLVGDRRSGRWIEYALVPEPRDHYVGSVLAMLRGPLDRDPDVVADRSRLREVRRVPLSELCERPLRRSSDPATTGRRARVAGAATTAGDGDRSRP